MRVGLMGGTFDPIHFGHLFIAEEARVVAGLSKVLFLPNRQPAHRQGKCANADPETRFSLTEIGIAGNPYFEISRVEIERDGPSFAYDTLKYFQAQLGEQAELHFIVGADSIAEVLTWHRGSELFEMCQFVAVTRPGFDLQEARRGLTQQQRGHVTWIETIGLHISSSDLRRRVGEGLPISYLVPRDVETEIMSRNLYRGD